MRHARIYPIVKTWPSEATKCETKDNGRVQLVFVFDRTQTFEDFFPLFEGIADGITTKIVAEYPGSEFGIVYFADYPSATRPHTGRAAVNPEDM